MILEELKASHTIASFWTISTDNDFFWRFLRYTHIFIFEVVLKKLLLLLSLIVAN